MTNHITMSSRKDESKNAKEMKKISKDAQDQDNDDHGGGH